MKKYLEYLLYIIAFFVVPFALYMVFIYSSIEATMGIVQKIFYFHLGSAISGFIAFVIVFICGILYLIKKEERYDIIGLASAEIGVIFITIVLITGVLWAKPAWNIWWTWDPRLTTTFVLWLLFVSYLLLRSNLKDNVNMPVYAAVFGIIAFLDVPLVFMSIRWWRTIHPVIIEKKSINLASDMLQTLIVSIVAVFFIFLILLINRIRPAALKRK